MAQQNNNLDINIISYVKALPESNCSTTLDGSAWHFHMKHQSADYRI